MRLGSCTILAALVAAIFLYSAPQVRAQDTLVVQYQQGGNVIYNALYDAFVGDTINRPSGRVYKLLKGGYYLNYNTINNTGRPLRIVGEAATAEPDSFPPLIQMYRDQGNPVPRMFSINDDLVLQGLTITGADDLGDQTSYQPLQVDGSGHKIVIDHCYFDRTNFAPIAFQNGANNVIYYTNNHFRNMLESPSTQKYAGRGISVWADQDTVIVENNTFFMVGFCVFQMEGGSIEYLRFNHNTLVNVGRQAFIAGAWRTSRFANNLIINPFWHGEDVADYTQSGRDPRAYNNGFWSVSPLPSVYGPEQGRSNLFTHTAAYRDPLFQEGSTYYADSIRASWFVNRVTIEDFLQRYPDFNKIGDTMWVAKPGPNFTYPDSLIPKMWQNITDLRRGITPATPYWYELPAFGGTYCAQCVKWPIPERFDYQTPSVLLTAGTDGLPLGDLNWFPTAKADFQANYQTYIDQIEALAPQPPSFSPVIDLQAERGTLANSAAVDSLPGTKWFRMEGSGFLLWDFTMPSAVDSNQLTLVVRTRSQDVDRGEHVYLNGVEIVNHPSNWGEYHWWCTPQFSDVPISKDSVITGRESFFLNSGTNSIRITPSWGYQDFAAILVVSGVDTVMRLLASDITTYATVFPRVELPGGGTPPWIPEYFKSVNMGSGGSVTWDINVPTGNAGPSTVQLFYQNYGPSQTAQVLLDGITVYASVTMDSQSDSTGVITLAYPPSFMLSEGAHTLAVVSSGIKLDHLVINRVTTFASPTAGLPNGFELRQNYPNPFNPATVISFTLPKALTVNLTVYNILGQRVATLVNEVMPPGVHSVPFDGRNFASGVYFYRLEAGDFLSSRKMMLLK
jgi:Secretion system C-terminal sorting domain/Right handed beta helix region